MKGQFQVVTHIIGNEYVCVVTWFLIDKMTMYKPQKVPKNSNFNNIMKISQNQFIYFSFKKLAFENFLSS